MRDVENYGKSPLKNFAWCVCILVGFALSCQGVDSNDHGVPRIDEDAGDPDVQDHVVETNMGPIRGIEYPSSSAFLGIPYAEPPVAELRFARPKPVKAWDGELRAQNFGPPCPQLGRDTISEDCLTLNIWAPASVGQSAPVMVWLHGGGLRSGSGDSEVARGRFMAETTGTVVVSLNYRLGPFGFLAHPAFGETSGNYGLLDQQMALLWVRDNIAAFGGNPNNVTLMGESAGSASTCVQMTLPSSKGLFHRAILQSGPCASLAPDGLSPVVTSEEAENQGKDLAEAVGCAYEADLVACLRSKSVDEILNALPLVPTGIVVGPGVNWFPNIDGEFLPDMPLSLIKEGKFHKVPTLIGTNGDEGTGFAAGADLIFMTGEDYVERVRARFGALAEDVLASYPTFAWGMPFSTYSKLLGDMVFVCSSRQTARALAGMGVPTFLYSFDVVPSYAGPMSFLGAFHAAEIPFVFHSLPAQAEFTSDEEELSKSMVKYWTNFARFGDPNSLGSTNWPLYDANEDRHLEFQLGSIEEGRNLSKDNCDFWDSIWP